MIITEKYSSIDLHFPATRRGLFGVGVLTEISKGDI